MTEHFRGLDVSSHQHPSLIDWPALARTHQFVICRALYGTRLDTRCAEHLKLAQSVGMLTGLYLFFRPIEDATLQLQAFERAAELFGMGAGWLLPALDIERNEKFDGAFTPERYVEQCHMIAEALHRLHGGALIYCNPNDWAELGSPEWIRDYQIWIAHHGAEQPRVPFDLPWRIWQHKVAPLPPVYPRVIDQNFARSPLPLIQSAADDWDEEEVTGVTRADLTKSAEELRRVCDAYMRGIELPRDREAETRARDRLISEGDD